MVVDFGIRDEAGVMAKFRNVQKSEVEVLPVVDLSAESAFFFLFFFVGDETQVSSCSLNQLV